jgi:hypothetical protein
MATPGNLHPSHFEESKIAGMFRVVNCAGFSGDRVDAPGPVIDTLIGLGGPCAVFFETLGERTVALAQLEKRGDPERGYEPMLERLLAAPSASSVS